MHIRSYVEADLARLIDLTIDTFGPVHESIGCVKLPVAVYFREL